MQIGVKAVLKILTIIPKIIKNKQRSNPYPKIKNLKNIITLTKTITQINLIQIIKYQTTVKTIQN